MTKKIFLFFLSVLVLLGLSTQALAADIPHQVIDAAKSVYYVETSGPQFVSSGTAFIIRTYTDAAYLITNNHVIQSNIDNVSVWIGEKEKTPAEVLKYSEEYDLALLKIAPSDSMREVTFSDKYERGESVYAIGFPAAADVLSTDTAHLGIDATITDGIISNIRTLQLVEFGPEVSILQINAALNSGNSGGPLVNKNGSVIGINTLGVEDAQGIFGSISVTDLEEFLSGTDVNLQYKGFPYLTVVLCAAAAVIILFAIFLILKLLKKSGAKERFSIKKGMLLEHYLQRFSDKLNPKAITSLMMPVALALRDKHLRGMLSLKLSPKYIKVTKEGCVLSDTCMDDGFFQQEFLSPEQLNNKTAGIYSDVYSYCAILKYMLSKASLLNDASADTAAWKAIVDKGMSADPLQRYASMQDLIFALSPYNGGLTKDLFVLRVSARSANAAVSTDKNRSAAISPHSTDSDKIDMIFPAGADIPFPDTTGSLNDAEQNETDTN